MVGVLLPGDVIKGAPRHESAAGRGGAVLLYRHGSDTLEHAFDLLPFRQRDDGLLPVRLKAMGAATAAFLAADVHRVDADDLDLEGVRDRQRDLGLRRLRWNPEEEFSGRHPGVALLTPHGPLHHPNRRSPSTP